MRLRIKALRRDRGWNQAELGDQVGIEQSGISRIERGQTEPTLANLVAIADALDVDFSELFEFSDEGGELLRLREIFAELPKPQRESLLLFGRMLRDGKVKPP